jgi:hypothetical protein
MFVLHFHKLVHETLDWTEAPGTIFVNKHMSILHKKKTQTVEHGDWCHDYEVLRLHIADTYPAYFGVILRVGGATMKNRHLITNHPVLKCGSPATLEA